MTSASAAIWTAYDHVDAFLQNLRLQQPADLGTVIPYLVLGIFSFIFAAIVVPSRPVVATQRPRPAAPAQPVSSDGKEQVNAAAAQSVQGEKEDNVASIAIKARVADTRPSASTWRDTSATLGLWAGWGWWWFAVVLCAVPEVKVIMAIMAMLAFGVVMTVATLSA